MKASKQIIVALALVAAVIAVVLVKATTVSTLARPNPRMLVKRAAPDMHASMHSHLSKKVFDRACAASKDTIDEIIACLTSNPDLIKAVKHETAAGCYKEAYGVDFDPKETMQHKELICKQRDKFELMTSCVYRKTAEVSDSNQMQKLSEILVDVGLCIINALDG